MSYKILFRISMVLNLLAIAALLLWLVPFRHSRNTLDPKYSNSTSANSEATNLFSTADEHPETKTSSTSTRPRFDWASIESEDYGQYVENLRRIGCPEATIRDIVSADLRQLFDHKRLEVLKLSIRTNYSDPSFMSGFEFDQAKLDALKKLENDYREIFRHLLKSDCAERVGFLANMDDPQEVALIIEFGPVAFEKSGPLAQWQQQLMREANKYGIRDGTPEFDALLAKMREQLPSILSPDEIETWKLRSSPLADALRTALGTFKPNEAEFRLIFRALDTTPSGLPEQGLLENQLRTILGPSRFAEYERSKSSN